MNDRPDMRVSDSERDEVVELLRGHLLSGRLDPDEHEERVEEACRAKYGRDLTRVLRELPSPAPAMVAAGPPVFVTRRSDSRPGAALALGLTGLGALLFTAGFGFVVALPLGILAWVLGARAAAMPPEVLGRSGRGKARTGMWLGVVTTTLSTLALVLVVLLLLGFGALSFAG